MWFTYRCDRRHLRPSRPGGSSSRPAACLALMCTSSPTRPARAHRRWSRRSTPCPTCWPVLEHVFS